MRATILSLLVLACTAAAQVKGPAEITTTVGRLAAVPLTIDGEESDYQVLGADIDAFREYSADPKQIKLRVIGYAPGTSYIVVACTKGGKLQPMFTVRVIVTGVGPTPPGPGPTPVPPDPPKPDPKPEPLPKSKLVVVVIEETDAASHTRAAWLNNKDLTAAMKAGGHKWRVVDKDAVDANGKQPADVARFLNDTAATFVPRMYLVDEAGKVRWYGAIPDSPARLAEYLTIYGGK